MARPNGSRNVRGWTATPKDMQKAGVSLADIESGLSDAQSNAVVAAIKERKVNKEAAKDKAFGKIALSKTKLEEYTSQISSSKKKNMELAVKLAEEMGFAARTTNPSGRKINSRYAAMYNNTTGELYINPSSSYWKDPVKNAAYNYKIGQLSTEHPFGVVFHELGHAKYKAPDNFQDNFRQRPIAERVSKYARMNPKEFVSETFAGLQTGKRYDEEVMRLYSLYARERDS